MNDGDFSEKDLALLADVAKAIESLHEEGSDKAKRHFYQSCREAVIKQALHNLFGEPEIEKGDLH